jgi:hypothetical protein
MQVKSVLAAVGIAAASSLISQAPAEAGWCWGPNPGPCNRGVVVHNIYYPNYYNVYYMATFAPDPYPYVYVPRGYWPRYERPYRRYARRYWAPRRYWGPRWGGCCAPAAYYAYPVPAPMPVPVEGRYLK